MCRFITWNDIKQTDGLGWVCVTFSFSILSQTPVRFVKKKKRELVSKVSTQTQQQQDVHSEQIQTEQQRGSLSGAEGHSEHPHQTRAASPSLQEAGDKVTENIQFISLYYYGYYDDERGGTAH